MAAAADSAAVDRCGRQKAHHGGGFLLCRKRLKHNTISAVRPSRGPRGVLARRTQNIPGGLVPIGSTLMYIYLPIAEMSVNIFLILGMGGMTACCPAFSASGWVPDDPAADFHRRPGAGRCRYRGQSNRRQLGFRCNRPLAARQCRFQNGRGPADRRFLGRPPESLFAFLRTVSQIDLVIAFVTWCSWALSARSCCMKASGPSCAHAPAAAR